MKYLIVFITLLILGFIYLTWLDSGCALGGMMTWNGKECVQ